MELGHILDFKPTLFIYFFYYADVHGNILDLFDILTFKSCKYSKDVFTRTLLILMIVLRMPQGTCFHDYHFW